MISTIPQKFSQFLLIRTNVETVKGLRAHFFGDKFYSVCILKKEYTKIPLLYLLPGNQKYPNGQSKRIKFLLMFRRRVYLIFQGILIMENSIQNISPKNAP